MLPNFEQKVLEIRKDTAVVCELLREALTDSLGGVIARSKHKLQTSIEGDIKHISYMVESIDHNVIVALALYGPEAGELRELVSILKITNELLRISDAIKKYSRGMQTLVEDGGLDIANAGNYAVELHKVSIKALDAVMQCFSDFNMDSYRAVYVEEEKSDEICLLFQKELISCSPQEEDGICKCMQMVKMLKKHERITDHCENIAKLIHYAKKGGRLEIN